MSKCLTIIAAILYVAAAEARKLEVGPGKTYAKPSQAAAAAQAGDTVEIAPGTYAGDAATWNAGNLVIRAPQRYAHIKAEGAQVQGKGIWVIKGSNVLVENIEFSEASVPDQNGAGIRSEGDNLTIRRCFFHDNENGILSGVAPNSDIVIEHTEFARNGLGDGYTHNIYIGHARSFTLRHSYSHHAKVGHNVKSRAERNFILYNRIMDEAEGNSSYLVDLPNGGFTVILGNLIHQGPRAANPTLVSYGAEGLSNAVKELYVFSNTLVNDRTAGGTFVRVASGATTARVGNNLYTGSGSLLSGTADTLANLRAADPAFVDKAGYDYRLRAASPAIDKGRAPGSAGETGLTPAWQYLHPVGAEARPQSGPLDIGAYEHSPTTAIPGPAAAPGRRRPLSGSRLRGSDAAGRFWESSGRRFDSRGRLRAGRPVRDGAADPES